MLYNGLEPHGHALGGVLEYLLCEPCMGPALAIHRPMIDGKYKWSDCTDEGCGFCKITRKIRAGGLPD